MCGHQTLRESETTACLQGGCGLTVVRWVWFMTCKTLLIRSPFQTLKRPQPSVSAANSIRETAMQGPNDTSPLLVISTAQAPLREKLAPLNMGDLSRGSLSSYPAAAQWNLMDFVDPLLVGESDSVNQSHDLFKASFWSPAGYSHLGG
jgi:hypothetical protein